MQSRGHHSSMPMPIAPPQGLIQHMGHHVPVLPRMPGAHSGLACLAQHAMFESKDGQYAKKRNLREDDGGVSGADVLLRAAKKARGDVSRREEAPFHVAIPARAPRGAYEPDEVARESGYIGVRWSRKKSKWRVRIKANGKDNHVGFFPDAEAAAKHYDNAAKRFFPQWKTDPSVRLNFPDGDSAQQSRPAAAGSPNLNAGDAARPGQSHPPAAPSSCLSAGINAILAASDSASASVATPPSSRSIGVSTAPSSGGSQSVGGRLVGVGAGSVPGVLALDVGKSKARKCPDKSSLEHLLDDKTALVRTPSPHDAMVTPSTGLGGTASSISTPATLPSPSTLWSPSGRGTCTETPPTVAGPPRLSAVAYSTAGFVAPAPAPCLPWQHGAVKKEARDREEAHSELEALRGLVELAGDKTLSRDKPPAVDFAIAHHQKASARPRLPDLDAAAAGSPAKKRGEPASKKVRERGRAVRVALTEAAEAEKQQPAAAPDSGGEGRRVRVAPVAVPRRAMGPVRGDGYGRTESSHRKSQNFRGVTWDKVKQMWRVRLCLAGGGREHIGYFADEHEGAMAYARALQRLKNELPAVRHEGPGSGLTAVDDEGAGAGAQRGAFSQVGAEGPREGGRPAMHPSDAAAQSAVGVGSVFQAVNAAGCAGS